MLVRPAVPDDAMAVARVHVRSWQAGYEGLMPAEVLDAQRPEDRAARYDFSATGPAAPRTLVATGEHGIGGFVTFGPGEPTTFDATWGEVYALYVDPDHWGAGMGRALMTAAREQLAADGCTDAGLWVLAGNERAERFYRIDGWEPDGTERDDQVWGVDVHEVRFRTRLR